MTSSETFVVAIDLLAGAGKSTVARALAKDLGHTFLDTGALYRTVALVASNKRSPGTTVFCWVSSPAGWKSCLSTRENEPGFWPTGRTSRTRSVRPKYPTAPPVCRLCRR